MTREEAIAVLEESKRQNEIMKDNPTTFWASYQIADGIKNTKRRIDALDAALSALRPVSREQVEKVWKGEWEFDAAEPNGKFGGIRCSKCHAAVSFGGENAFHNAKAFDSFCPFCGAPMTDEAVQMVMERMEALKDGKGD